MRTSFCHILNLTRWLLLWVLFEIIKLMDDSLKMFKISISGDIELSLFLCLIILIMSSIDQLQHRVVAMVRCLRSRRVQRLVSR